jgi:predicted N-formylglutamate amidohydrolase
VADAFLITCEHGGNRIPAPYRTLFRDSQALLDSHRGYDPGALILARELACALNAALETSTVSRLLVDLNRSIGHPQLFSPAIRNAPVKVREEIVARHYTPYRVRIEHRVGESVASGRRVIHISSHSFTPELDGKVRNADAGLLYHPGRPGELALCARWRQALAAQAPALRVRRNYPYAGKGDGVTSALRRRFSAEAYVGIELEINQAIVLAGGQGWAALRQVLIDSLRAACAPEPR